MAPYRIGAFEKSAIVSLREKILLNKSDLLSQFQAADPNNIGKMLIDFIMIGHIIGTLICIK